jgi:AcrR family transcriptional regulator
VTTGSLYHHFESKIGLYLVVREEMEQRVVDRMTGAAAVAGDDPVGAALLSVADGVPSTTVRSSLSCLLDGAARSPARR